MTYSNYLSNYSILERNSHNPMPGDRVDLDLLYPLPLTLRREIDAEAHTMQNYIGGIRSNCIRAALRNYREGRGFPYRDRADAHRKAEKAERERTGRFVILPMN